MNFVFDASAMIAFLRGEQGAELVADRLQQVGSRSFAHSINLCEVYYDFARASGEEVAAEAVEDLLALGLSERSDFDSTFWRSMGRLKASQRRIYLADCAALELTHRLDGTLLTADRHELEAVQSTGRYTLEFIR